MAKKTAAEQGEWWGDVIKRDKNLQRYGDESYAKAARRLVRCVFCNRDLWAPLKKVVAAKKGGTVAMLATWSDSGGMIFGSGLYCHGPEGCVREATALGRLGDMHAEAFCGAATMEELAVRASDYSKWEVDALRRYVLVCAALSTIK